MFAGLDADANYGFVGYNAGSGGFVNALSFNTSGQVGIGESSPSAALHVKTSTNTPLLLESTHSNGGYVEYQTGASGAVLGYIGAGSALVTGGATSDFAIRSQAAFEIATGGNTERFRIDNVGTATFTGPSSATAVSYTHLRAHET